MKIYRTQNLNHTQNFLINFKGKNVIEPMFKQILSLPDKSHCPGYLYNQVNLPFVINFENLKRLGIPNLQLTGNHGVRGETLSSSKNYKYLSKLKENGIYTIIDLRTADYTEKFKAKCSKFGLNYFHIPIDEKTTSDREILDSLPIFFEQLAKGNFYIACAQGRHRTDIALALNYLFNPTASIVPIMYGHIKSGKFRCQDIFTRANSLYKSMTIDDKAKFGWTEQFEKNFSTRKKALKAFNEQYSHSEFISESI